MAFMTALSGIGGTLSTALSVASAGMGLLGAKYQADAQSAAYRSQAEAARQNALVAEHNAKISDEQGAETLARGAREEARFRQAMMQQAATQKSDLVAKGAGLTGSALQVMQQTQTGIEEDVTRLRYNILQDMYGNRVQSTNFRAEAAGLRNDARMADTAASNARKSGRIGMIGGLMGVGASLSAGLGGQTKANYSPQGITIEPFYDSSLNGISSAGTAWSNYAGSTRGIPQMQNWWRKV